MCYLTLHRFLHCVAGPGGRPSQAVTPKAIAASAAAAAAAAASGEVSAQATLASTEPTIKLCPDGLWTQEPGAVDAVQCCESLLGWGVLDGREQSYFQFHTF
jgi:hypothetical protein